MMLRHRHFADRGFGDKRIFFHRCTLEFPFDIGADLLDGLLLSQRGPKATISLVYCMARAASTCMRRASGLYCFGGSIWAPACAG